jgi:uncharacterized protein (DUF1499 family)
MSPASARSALASRRPLSRLALAAFYGAILIGLVAMFAGLGSRLGWWHFRTGFTLLRWAAYGGLAVAVLSLAAMVVARPGGPRRGLALAVLGLLVGLAVAGIPWQWRRTARSVPPIHDIATDTENPPEFVAILPLRADAPNSAEYEGPEIAAQQREAYPDIQPLELNVPPSQAFERALEAARELGWAIVDTNEAEGRIEATDRTLWFGFYDDVVIRVTPAGTGSRIDVRSLSRVGGSDVGTNARRIRQFLAEMREG